MAKRTDTNIELMDEPGFDQETIANVTAVPLRTINDITDRRGCWVIQPSLTSCGSHTGCTCESSSWTTPWPLA